ncbi:DUF3558 domain-containing protein [Nocardia rhamnosiphila]
MRTARKNTAAVIRRVVLAVAGAGLVAGCATTVDGAPETEGAPNSGEQQFVDWNPCSDLSDEALRASGVDPGSKNSRTDAPGDEALWRICAWNASDGPYFVGVGSSSSPQDLLYENTSITGITARRVNGRAGLTFYPNGNDDPIRRCYTSVPTARGMVTVYVDWQYSQRNSMPESPPCGLAVEHAEKLEPYLPK